MKKESVTDKMKRIDAFIMGNLNKDEIEGLWVEILKAPEWMEIVEIEVLLRKNKFYPFTS